MAATFIYSKNRQSSDEGDCAPQKKGERERDKQKWHNISFIYTCIYNLGTSVVLYRLIIRIQHSKESYHSVPNTQICYTHTICDL